MGYTIRKNLGESIAVPQIVFSGMKSTNEANVRVALYITATGCTDAAQIARDLCLRSAETAEQAMLWWCNAGLLEKSEEPQPAEKPQNMTWQQIMQASRTDPMIANLIDCAQRSFAKSLSHSEMERLARLYLQDGYDPEVITLCIGYAALEKKTTVAALSRELEQWSAEGVTTGEEANRYLMKLEERKKHLKAVCAQLDCDEEALTLGAKKAVARWYEEYGFDDSMVTEAILQAGKGRDVWYINGILKKWHAQGILTVQAVRGGGAMDGADSRNVRVDRQNPSGNDYLSQALKRPRSFKRKD